ncbi:MAG: type IV secretion system DNA-binding domain-containing protein [Candidatus Moranbacteria bacterium]|nr:type IV secretion system DNA-binding domain-containing protein [Candidatus Moranbacteria bacterium]
MTESFLIIILATVFILPPFLWYFLFFKVRKKGRLERATTMVLLSVSLPREEDKENKEEKKDDKEIVAITEQLLIGLYRMRDSFLKELFFGKPQFTLEIANPFDDDGIYFFIACPKRFATSVEKQIYGFFPKANVIRKKGDFNIFTPSGKSMGTYMTLRRKPFLPIKTYKLLESDSLNNITNSLSKLKKVEEGAAIQIILQSASTDWKNKSLLIARRMKQGESYNRAKRNTFFRFVGEFMSLPIKKDENQMANTNEPNMYGTRQQDLRQLTPGEEEKLKLIEEKTLKPAFEVNIRLLASSDNKERAQEILNHMVGAFSQFDSVDMNGLITRKPLSLKDLIFNFSFRNFSKKFKCLLNSEEISSIFHFPIYSTQTPKLDIVKAKTAAAPVNVPNEGLLLGKNVYRGMETDIFLGRDDRRRHLYTIGQTGTGKSGFLHEMARQDIQNGEGVCIIDPHGELVEEVIAQVPPNRIQDVILFDPSDIERPMGLNLLEYDKPEQKTFVINEMISIFDKLYDLKQTGGPMFEQYMRNAMLLVMAHPESGSTLMEISKVLADADFRRMKLDNCDNQVVVDFWTKEAEKAGGEAALANMVPYITSKLTTFVTNDIMRPIISQQKSAFNFRKAMDEQKIVLVNLSKGKIGDINANLLGMVIVGKILMSSMGRVDMPQDQRKDFYLYIDEFQNVTTESIASILSEARKYRLNLIIAHQFIQQLEEKIRDAVFGNVGSMVTFRIGATDAEYVVKQYVPVFSEKDLINVDNFKAFTKVMISGEVSSPFSLETYPPKPGMYNLQDQIRDHSRNTYGRDRMEIERELKERMELADKPKKNLFEDDEDYDPIDSDMPPK